LPFVISLVFILKNIRQTTLCQEKQNLMVDRIPFFMHNAAVLSKRENIQSMHQKSINRFHVHFLNRFSGL